MSPRHIVLLLSGLAITGWAAPALADIPPRPSGPCRCSTPGIPSTGALPASLLGAGVLLLATRMRRR